jgi:hypothetical protein
MLLLGEICLGWRCERDEEARRVCWLNKTQALQGAVTLRRANDTADVNASVSALQSNLRRHRTEVSRGRISRECRKGQAVKGRT